MLETRLSGQDVGCRCRWGTIDLVAQEKADDDPKSMKVHEVVGSYGEINGGTFVECFKDFCHQMSP